MLGCTACLNPGTFAVSLYSPTGSCAIRNSPDSFETAVNFSCVPASVATIEALGTAAPEGSLTWPVISAVFICPNADEAVNTKIPTRERTAQKPPVNGQIEGVPQD